jgi:hypothetical protein
MTLRGGMGRNGRRLRVNPTDGWEQIELLCGWPEQWDYELIHPLVLFDASVAERTREVGSSASTLYRRLDETPDSLGPSDTTLIPPRAQYGGTHGNPEQRKLPKYAVFATSCKPLQCLSDHS